MLKPVSLFLALALASSPAMAQQKAGSVTLEGSVKREKTVQVDGQTRTVTEEPKVVVPGDKLLFSNKYANKGVQRVDNFVVTNPVPAAVRVADERLAGMQVSVDGGKVYGLLARLSVKEADGSLRPARAEDITHIRWTVATIAPGEGGSVEYRAIVR